MLKFCTRFLRTNVYKSVFGMFFILFRTWFICQNQNYLVSPHSQKPGLSITQDLNKIKENPGEPFVNIGKTEMCAKFQQKMLNSIVVGARQNFNFSEKQPGFSETKELCFNLSTGFCIT